jgi:hypothetical protein
MEALFQIVGCVVSSKPAAERIDDFVAQVRRERAVVMGKDALSASFVRFSTPDARLVVLACHAALVQGPAMLRFGFASGTKEPLQKGQSGPGISQRSIAQASDLAAGARDGEVLVAPELAALLIESGVSLHSRQVHLPDGRTVAACSLSLGADPSDGRWADGLGNVYRTLTAQAGEVAHKQVELEARLDAALGKIATVDQGNKLATHLGALEAELDAQLMRVETRLRFIDGVEQRVAALVQSLEDARQAVAAFEDRLSGLDRGSEALEQRVQSRADALSHMLGDINAKLEVLGEQRSVIDHVGDKVAHLNFTVQEAQNTLRALQREREVAERIEQGIKALRARGGAQRLV